MMKKKRTSGKLTFNEEGEKVTFNEEVWTPYPVATDRTIIQKLHKVVINEQLPLSKDPLTYDNTEISYDRYKKNRNPLMLIDAFLLAHQWNQYPPVWVIREISKIFTEAYDSEANLNLLLGFVKSGAGRGIPFSKKNDTKSEQDVMITVFRLKTYYGCTRNEAVEAAVKTKGHNLSEGTINRKYSTKWSPIFNSKLYQYESSTKEWLKNNKKKFLSQFSADDIKKLTEKYHLKMLRG